MQKKKYKKSNKECKCKSLAKSNPEIIPQRHQPKNTPIYEKTIKNRLKLKIMLFDVS